MWALEIPVPLYVTKWVYCSIRSSDLPIHSSLSLLFRHLAPLKIRSGSLCLLGTDVAKNLALMTISDYNISSNTSHPLQSTLRDSNRTSSPLDKKISRFRYQRVLTAFKKIPVGDVTQVAFGQQDPNDGILPIDDTGPLTWDVRMVHDGY